jgi:hypothetical protein
MYEQQSTGTSRAGLPTQQGWQHVALQVGAMSTGTIGALDSNNIAQQLRPSAACMSS